MKNWSFQDKIVAGIFALLLLAILIGGLLHPQHTSSMDDRTRTYSTGALLRLTATAWTKIQAALF